jgi:hypothetical protein
MAGKVCLGRDWPVAISSFECHSRLNVIHLIDIILQYLDRLGLVSFLASDRVFT